MDRDSDLIEETEERVLQQEKQYLVQDITEELEHLTKQLVVVNENVQRILRKQEELNIFADQWSQFQAQLQNRKDEEATQRKLVSSMSRGCHQSLETS